MDKRSMIGLLLIGALLIGYSIITRPSRDEIERQQRTRDSIAQVEIQKQLEAERILREQELKEAMLDSLSDQEKKAEENLRQLGAFAQSADGQEEKVVLENQKIRLTFTNKGGRLYSAELKEYKTHDSLPLLLFDGEETRFNIQFFAQNKGIATQDLFFEPIAEEPYMNVTDQAKSLTMRLNAGEGRYIDYVYTLHPDTYQLMLNIHLSGMDELIAANSTYVDLDWGFPLRQQEKGYKWETQYSSIYYKFFQDEVDKIQPRKSGSADLTTRVEWIAYKQQFFSTIIKAETFMTSARVQTEDRAEESGYLKYCGSSISLPYESKASVDIPLSFYFVPNHFKTLKDIGFEFSELVDLGWPFISWINKWFVINFFHYLESVFGNYGIIIIILTIFFKLLVMPLTYRSNISGAKMRLLKPQIEELNKKYGADKAMEKQQATMALYKKAGVNPMGGCLPALLQMPIWLALFRFFPASIELRQQSFLWAKDLSSYDSILNLPFTIPAYGDHISLFTLLMAISMLVTTKINMDQTATAQPMPGMKLMMYLMPVMMLVWFNSYASGLSFYYFVSNVISYLQQIIIKRTINEDKLLSKMKENQKKPVKKSNFQARLEEMAKQRGSVPARKK